MLWAAPPLHDWQQAGEPQGEAAFPAPHMASLGHLNKGPAAGHTMARDRPFAGGRVPWQPWRCGMHLRRSAFKTSARMGSLASPALLTFTRWAT